MKRTDQKGKRITEIIDLIPEIESADESKDIAGVMMLPRGETERKRYLYIFINCNIVL